MTRTSSQVCLSVPLYVETGMDLVIVLLYSPSKSGKVLEPIETVTRLQKLLFLLQQDIRLVHLVKRAEAYQYEARSMGPYSEKLSNDLQELESAGVIVGKQMQEWIGDDGDVVPTLDDFDMPGREPKRFESYRFSLSLDLGQKSGKALWDSLARKDRQGLVDFKAFFNSLSLRQLLIFIYGKYPRFTGASMIREQLLKGER